MQDYEIIGQLMAYDSWGSVTIDRMAIHLVYVSSTRKFSREDTLHHYALSDKGFDYLIAHYKTHQERLDKQAKNNKALQHYLTLLSKPAVDPIDHLEKLLYDPLNFVRSRRLSGWWIREKYGRFEP